MSKRSRKSKIQTWVVKIGSAALMEGGPLLLRAWVLQIAKLRKDYNVQVIWVSSGAIASARTRTGRKVQRLSDKQALSAIGQPILMDSYNLALQAQGLIGSQVLLTYFDLQHKEQKKNLKNTLSTLLSWNVIPILNENDAVATEEIQFGDNDLLSAKVACLMDVDRLVIMTNVEGLYDKNPAKYKEARLVSELPRVTKSHLDNLDPQAISVSGRGGMFSKMRAAAHAQKEGIGTFLVKADVPDVLIKVAAGDLIGTRIGFGKKRS